MGYEKFMMDVDQAGMMHTLLEGVDLSENGQALDAIREVGPGKLSSAARTRRRISRRRSIAHRWRITTASSSGMRRARRT